MVKIYCVDWIVCLKEIVFFGKSCCCLFFFTLPHPLSFSLALSLFAFPVSPRTIKFILDASTLTVLIVIMPLILVFHAEAAKHLKLLSLNGFSALSSSISGKGQLPGEMVTAPLFSLPARAVLSAKDQRETTSHVTDHVYPQYGLLGHRLDTFLQGITHNSLVYTSTATPCSTFICGSHGSGKSKHSRVY